MPNSVSLMSNSFHIVVNLSNIMKTWYLHHLQKSCVLKAIWYENRAKLYLLNGNKRPIRYESHNGVKPSRYNLNNPYKEWYLCWQIAVTVLKNLVIIVSSLSTRCFIKKKIICKRSFWHGLPPPIRIGSHFDRLLSPLKCECNNWMPLKRSEIKYRTGKKNQFPGILIVTVTYLLNI